VAGKVSEEQTSNTEGLTSDSSTVRDVFFPGHRSGLGNALLIRGGIALGCLFLATALVYIGRDGYTDSQNPGEPISLLNAFYFATVSLSTTGYGDIVPSSDLDRFISAVVITPLRIVFLIVLVGSTLEVLTKRTQAEYREKRWRKRVKNHTIVVGFGVKGKSAVGTLIDDGGDPHQIVVISPNASEIQDATTLGCTGIVGDARRDDILERAAVTRCARAIIAPDSDDKAVLITLNIRRLAPKATVVAAVREAQHVAVLRQSGANAVITTAEAAGRLMGISLVSPTAGSIMEDLLDPGEGLEVRERELQPHEVGLMVGDLADRGEIVLAVVRDGQVHRFDQPEARVLQDEDRIVAIRHIGDRGPTP